jgi:hypothetical protein
MEAWLVIEDIRILLAVTSETVDRIGKMSNSERMDLRQSVSNDLEKTVATILKK